MSRFNRQKSPSRRAPFRDPKAVILVVTEGDLTEPSYLEGFVKFTRNSRVKLEINGAGCGPSCVVRQAKALKKEADNRARREKDENCKYDEVWVVFDCDDHANVNASRSQATSAGIKVAYSNPCFELWLYLHFESVGMIHRDVLRKKLKAKVPGYDKYVDFNKFKGGYNHAVSNAISLQKVCDLLNEPGKNPSTGVWELTESIRTKA